MKDRARAALDSAVVFGLLGFSRLNAHAGGRISCLGTLGLLLLGRRVAFADFNGRLGVFEAGVLALALALLFDSADRAEHGRAEAVVLGRAAPAVCGLFVGAAASLADELVTGTDP